MSSKDKVSYGLPIKKLILLQVFSIGLYQLYWYYNNWRILKIHNKIRAKPWLLMLGLLIPIYNYYLLYTQYKLIRDFANEKGVVSYKFPSLLILVFIVIGFVFYQVSLLPFPYYFFSNIGFISPVIILVIVQTTLNRCWAVEKGSTFSQSLSTSEHIIIALGIFTAFLTNVYF